MNKNIQHPKEVALEDIKIIFKQSFLPSWLPKEVLSSANKHYEYLKNRVSFLQKVREENLKRGINWIAEYKEEVDRFNIAKNLFFDDRMKNVWNKLYKINQEETGKLFSFLVHKDLTNHEVRNQRENSGHNPKISAVKAGLKICEDFVEKLDSIGHFYSSFNPSAPKANSRLWLHGDVTDALCSGLEIYTNGLKKIINHYEKNRGVFDRLDYMQSPTSRKSSIKNSKAIYLARLIKIHFLTHYKRPLNKEIGEILSVLFGDNNDVYYDADYVAKVTKDADKTYEMAQKMEDSPDIYDYKPSF